MKLSYSKEDRDKAIKVNLHDFLLENHGERFTKEGSSIRFADNKSISIKDGYAGYYDFATQKGGNGIDFLTEYLDYNIVDAVLALAEYVDDNEDMYIPPAKKEAKVFEEPEPNLNNDKITIYLSNRGIDINLINKLINKGLIYESKQYNNIVFINKDKTWAEIHGSNSNGPSYHGMGTGSSSDGYWAFTTNDDYEHVDSIYICEAAIDAMSLCQIHMKDHPSNSNSMYVSIGGCGKQNAIESVKYDYCDCYVKNKIVLAVDNDHAGENCRNKNSDLVFLIPNKKDWNEDLKELCSKDEFLDENEKNAGTLYVKASNKENVTVIYNELMDYIMKNGLVKGNGSLQIVIVAVQEKKILDIGKYDLNDEIVKEIEAKFGPDNVVFSK